jgi:hypothetical protein
VTEPSPELAPLNLTAWPFSVVPSENQGTLWVGREEARDKLRALLRTVERVQASRIILLWADYGQGKTHALRYIQSLVADNDQLCALYIATPQGIKSFVDLYRGVIEAALASELIDRLGLALYRKHGAEAPTDLQRALVRLVSFEEPHTRAALAWLKAERVEMRSLREVGIGQRIETSIDGIEVLNELIRLLRDELEVKLMLLIDEIQELGELRPRQLEEAVGGLHKVFDRNAEGLTLVLSFTTDQQDTIKRIIGETLYERRSELLTLPALDEDAGAEFIRGLIEEWSVNRERAPFPFEPEAIDTVVARLYSNGGALTPRELIRSFDSILRAGDLAIEDGRISVIDASFAEESLPGA